MELQKNQLPGIGQGFNKMQESQGMQESQPMNNGYNYPSLSVSNASLVSQSEVVRYTCPITQTIMTNPYVTPAGHSYEKKAIEEWIQKKHTDPMTGAPLQQHQINPNLALKESIERYQQKCKNQMAR
jgi:hypothetical protein